MTVTCADSAVESEKSGSCASCAFSDLSYDSGNKDRSTLSYLTALKGRGRRRTVFTGRSEPRYLRRWLPWLDGVKSASDTLNFIQRCSECAAAGTEFHYALLLDGEIVGLVSFNSLRRTIVVQLWGIGSLGPKLAEDS